MGEIAKKKSASKTKKSLYPLATGPVPIDDVCSGERWTPQNTEEIARLVAVIAMGQAAYASHIIKELAPAAPVFSTDELLAEAKIRLSVQEKKVTPRTGYPRWQRDGFLFEAISWIAARQTYGGNALLKDPHVSATSQGLDGLMIELSADKSEIAATTVFEDKCTDNPRDTFTQKVLPAFKERHQNKRSAEIVAAATVLLRIAGIGEEAAVQLAAAVTDRTGRRYRAAFALPGDYDTQAERRALFSGYEAIQGISAKQRIGACFIVPAEVRDWLDSLAATAIAFLDEIGSAGRRKADV